MSKRKFQIISGSDYDDSLVATSSQRSKVFGFSGNDIVKGNDDFDNYLYAGDGDDLVYGGVASKVIDGNTGNDRVSAVAISNQKIYGGTGDDDIDLDFSYYALSSKARGSILLDAGDGDDNIRFRNENASAKKVRTSIVGGSGNDTLSIDRHQYQDKVSYDLGDGDDTARLIRAPEPARTIITGGNGYDFITGEALNSLAEVRETAPGSYALIFRAYQINGIGYEQVVSVPGFEAIRNDYMQEYSLVELAAMGTQLPWF